MIVEAVENPDSFPLGEGHLGGVDLPEIVGGSLEAFRRLAAVRLAEGDEAVSPKRLVDRGSRGRVDACSGKLRADPPRTPARMTVSQLADLRLQDDGDLRRRGAGPARPRCEADRTLLEESPPVAVVARPRDPTPPAHLRDRVARPLGLRQQIQLELFHRHHLESHTRLPHSPVTVGGKAESAIGGVSDLPERLRCARNELPQIYPVTTGEPIGRAPVMRQSTIEPVDSGRRLWTSMD